eukprot:1225724-Pleurochrysis_carterae.AAC.3
MTKPNVICLQARNLYFSALSIVVLLSTANARSDDDQCNAPSGANPLSSGQSQEMRNDSCDEICLFGADEATSIL